MNKTTRILAGIALLLSVRVLHSQVTSHTAYRVIGANSLPASCVYSAKAPDIISVSNAFYLCESDNTYHQLATGGGISGLTSGYLPVATSGTTIGNSNCNELTAATLSCIEAISSISDGVHAGGTALVGNTTVPTWANHTSTPNSNGDLGPNSASFTSWWRQWQAAAPSTTSFVQAAAESSDVSQFTLVTAIPSAFTATTQSACDNSTKLATTAYAGTTCNLVKTSGSPFSATAQSQTIWNNTASTYAVALPTPTASGPQICLGDYQARTGAISFVPGTGITIYYKGAAGTTSSATGLVSGGAAGDFICLEGTDTTTYEAIGPGIGTWTNN